MKRQKIFAFVGYLIFLLAWESPVLRAGSPLLSPEALGERTLEGREIYSFESARSRGKAFLPFADDADLDRVCIDEDVSLDLTEQESFILEMTMDQPKAVLSISFYFRAPGGWYLFLAKPVGLVRANRRAQYRFRLSEAAIEGNPAGLDKIDGIRVAFVHGDSVNANVTVHSLKIVESDMFALLADPEANGDAAWGREYLKIFQTLGFSFTPLYASHLSDTILSKASVVLIPISSNLNDEQINTLCRYVKNGGFLFLFYTQPDKLLNAVGFETGTFIRDPKRERFAEIRFHQDYAALFGKNFPDQIYQSSYNITTARPLPDENLPEYLRAKEARPRVVADWYTKEGIASGEPAILVSGRGIYWSRVLQKDGHLSEKRDYLTEVFSKLNPNFFKAALQRQWRKTIDIGLDLSDPNIDPEQFRAEKLTEILPRLAEEGWTSERIENALFGDDVSFNERDLLMTLFIQVANERGAAYCASIPSKPIEGRLWWEHSGLGIYPGDWDRTMKELSEARFNAIVPNMLWGGSALYKSDFLPEDERCAQYGDQMAQAVEAGKKYGVQVHVWKVNWNCGRAPKSFLEQMSAEGRLQRSIDGEEIDWLCPSDPRNRQLEADVMLEAATKYDAAGIHFDYIRYSGGEYCYCDGCRERFSKHYKEMTGEELTGWPKSIYSNSKAQKMWSQWRRDNITALVREVRRRIDQERPECKISAAVLAQYPTCCGNMAQDWGSWVNEGLLDFVCPMDYTANAVVFSTMVKKQVSLLDGKCKIFPGIGATATGLLLTPEEVAMQIGIARRLGTDGFTMFKLDQETAKRHFEPLHTGPAREKAIFPDRGKP